MILIRNQKGSPDLRSFRVTVNQVISSFIAANNMDDNKAKLPLANVNVIGIPQVEKWDKYLVV